MGIKRRPDGSVVRKTYAFGSPNISKFVALLTEVGYCNISIATSNPQHCLLVSWPPIGRRCCHCDVYTNYPSIKHCFVLFVPCLIFIPLHSFWSYRRKWTSFKNRSFGEDGLTKYRSILLHSFPSSFTVLHAVWPTVSLIPFQCMPTSAKHIVCS